MLVLTRRKDEVVMIGDDIEVMVVAIRGDKVQLGISAPRDVQIDRKEIRDLPDFMPRKVRATEDAQ